MEKPETMPRFKGEILLCEDSEINQQYIKSHLNMLGFDVVIAGNGSEGVEVVKSRNDPPFDLIFMDIQMPVMDGLEAADALISMGVKTPMVALTANVTQEDKTLYASHGMAKSLCKPFVPEDLWACLLEFFTPVSREAVAAEARAAEEEKQRKKLFSGFVRRNQTTYEDICAALDNGDVKLAHRLAHTLRGLAGLMGKNELQEAARVAEYTLAGGEALSEESLKTLEHELKKVLAELEPYLHDTAQETAHSFDKNAAKELFEQLEPLLREDNAKAQRFSEALRAVPGTGELINQLDDYEFEAALEALTKLRKSLDI